MSTLNNTFEPSHSISRLLSKFGLVVWGLMCCFPLFSQDLATCYKQGLHKAFRTDNKANNQAVEIPKLEAFWTLNMNNGNLEGRVIQNVKALTSIDKLEFELSANLSVSTVLIHDKPVAFNHSQGKVIITGPIESDHNGISRVEINYSGQPTNNQNRSYEFRTHEGNPIIWTLSEPYGAKDWWPAIQQLNYKIDTCILHISFPENNRSASNGLLKNRVVNNGIATETWEHLAPINYYLIAIAATNYEEYSYDINLREGPVLFQNLIYPERSTQNKPLIDQTAEILPFLDSLLTPYPYSEEKYGHAQWGWGGGMEHQTMSFMVNFSFDLIAHELAHQWFGDYITCSSWQDIWLNEGFATYFNYICREFLSDPAIAENQLLNLRERSLEAETGFVFAQDTLDVPLLFSNRLSYSKGAFVLHMLRAELGDSLFFLSIRDYLRNFGEKGFANTIDFKTSVEQSSNRDFSHFFDQWIYNESYPVVNYSWDSSGNINYLSLEQFLKSNNSPSNFNIKIPVLLKGFDQDSLIHIRLSQSSQNFIIESHFPVDEIRIDPKQTLLMESKLSSAPFSNNSGALFIFPNPVKDRITLISRSSSYLIEEVFVIDALGRKVLRLNYEQAGRFKEMDLSPLSPGSYHLSTIYRGESKQISFIKQ